MVRVYRNNVAGGFAPTRVEDLEPYVAAERGKGRTWAQIARAVRKSEADLKRTYGRKYP